MDEIKQKYGFGLGLKFGRTSPVQLVHALMMQVWARFGSQFGPVQSSNATPLCATYIQCTLCNKVVYLKEISLFALAVAMYQFHL